MKKKREKKKENLTYPIAQRYDIFREMISSMWLTMKVNA